MAAFGANGITSSFMFVVGCHVADVGVQPDRVVLRPDEFEFGFEFAGSVIFSRCGHSPLT